MKSEDLWTQTLPLRTAGRVEGSGDVAKHAATDRVEVVLRETAGAVEVLITDNKSDVSVIWRAWLERGGAAAGPR